MGKKARKTRWRTLAINSGEQSDSEESNSQSGQHQISKGYPQKPFYSKFPYSSQSTPIRSRFQNDTKSTRSSSTTSENKITFNEDEYTKITTPRQDVLFKKGYLSKPKTYQTQTSTGNSTVSTGNSTGNGTPDHQSADGTEGTDLEYESQFVFPNGYVDPNGIYYINSFEPYPLVVYNAAPYCYPEYPINRSKRYSTDSLTESTSPHNEETSQDQSQSGGETFGVSDQTKPTVNGHHCEDDDVAAASAPADLENGDASTEPRKIKKRRRRKLSKPIPDGTSSDEGDATEVISEIVNRIPQSTDDVEICETKKTIELKPDAKEFVPRAYQTVQFIPNFIPLPLINELPPNFNPAFLPPGIPINFIPPDHKMVHNFVNFIPNYVPKVYETTTPTIEPEELKSESKPPEETPEVIETTKVQTYKNIDIEKIVSKLEEAAKEQRFYENRKQKYSPHKFNKNIAKPRHDKFNADKKAPRKHEIRRLSIEEREPKKPEEVKEEMKIVNTVHKPDTCSNVARVNYAETLQKKKVEKLEKIIEIKKVASITSPKPAPPLPNQWISVSNRKKRKNKGIAECENEVEAEIETEIQTREDDFETYDVDQLKDVIVANEPDNKPVPEIEPPKPDVVELVEEIKPETKDECEEIDLLIKSLEEIEVKANMIKKKNKGGQKTKRVMITDLDLTETTSKKDVLSSPVKITNIPQLEIKSEVVETKKKQETKKVSQIEQSKTTTEPKTEEVIESKVDDLKTKIDVTVAKSTSEPKIEDVLIASQPNPENAVTTPEIVSSSLQAKLKLDSNETKSTKNEVTAQNSQTEVESKDKLVETDVIEPVEDVETPEKRRGKKKKKSAKPKPLSKSSSTATLNNFDETYDFLLNNSLLEDEKTNVEISEELSKIIQRGMYSSLEEKIKSLNITAANDGFFKTISFGEKVEKPNDLTNVVNTSNLFKPKRTSIEDVDLTKITLPNFEPSASGSFLDVSNVQKDPGIPQSSLYPITQAVKDWMTKTRETTPEMEILKSPSTILKEVLLTAGEDEEVIFSKDWSLTPESSFEEDLLEWDDEAQIADKKNGKIEIAEDVLEIYESKYGKNEDYDKIKSEIEEKKKNGTFPKHANLPYRAICCSLM